MIYDHHVMFSLSMHLLIIAIKGILTSCQGSASIFQMHFYILGNMHLQIVHDLFTSMSILIRLKYSTNLAIE